MTYLIVYKQNLKDTCLNNLQQIFDDGFEIYKDLIEHKNNKD